MEGYRILLVDDEEELRAGIRRRIDWEALGFVLAGEAANGQDALELAEQLRPDVVLTDIKMPFMDGLTLCRQLKTQLPAVRLVIFSGFDEFDYEMCIRDRFVVDSDVDKIRVPYQMYDGTSEE